MAEPTTVEEATAGIIAALLADPDAIRRYRTIQALQDGGLRDAAATSMRQLRDQLGSTDAAAAALGISRQAMNELLAKAGAPGARADKGLRDRPAYRYGQYYDLVYSLAEIAGQPKHIDRVEKLHDLASMSLSGFPVLAEAASVILRTVRRMNAGRASNLEARLDELGAPVGEWMAGRAGSAYLSMEEKKEFMLGMHQARAARRDARRDAAQA